MIFNVEVVCMYKRDLLACLIAAGRRGGVAIVAVVAGITPAQAAPKGPASTSSTYACTPISAAVASQIQMTLRGSAAEEVKEDTVTITITAEVEASDQADVGQKLNAVLDHLMRRAKGAQEVNVRTGNYYVWSNNTKGKLINWWGRGSIIIESANFAAASALAGQLGEKAAITSIIFTLSRQGREVVERRLLKQAAQVFRERAQAATLAFGFVNYRIQKLELSGEGGIKPRPYLAMAKVSMPGSQPDVPLEPGTTTVSVDVSGTIVLN
jgi:predicted secreted protein